MDLAAVVVVVSVNGVAVEDDIWVGMRVDGVVV